MCQYRVRPMQGCILFVLVVVGTLMTAGPAAATKYAGSFMENGGGARALGMAGAFTAVADDPSATFWNPAGLSELEKREIMLMHSERFGDLIDRDFAVYTQPVNWNLFGGQSSGIGVTLIRLGIDNIPFTDHLAAALDDPANGGNGDGIVDDDELQGLFGLQDQIRYESDQEFALLLSYGERLGKWSVGGSLKFVRQTVGQYGSMGIGLDAAVLRPKLWKRLDFGMKFQDITTTYLSWDSPSGRNEIIAPALVPGFAWNEPVASWNMRFTLATSFETRFENRITADQYHLSGSVTTNVHLGGEIAFGEKVFLRGGFDSGWEAENLTAGAGFHINPLTVDYAYAGDSLDIDEVTHRISLSVGF